MTKQTKPTKQIDLKKLIKIGFLFSIFFLMVATVYHVYYARRIIPGVRIANVRVGGMTYQQAKQELEKKDAATNKDLKLTYADFSYTIAQEEIELSYDWDQTVSRAFEVGRTGIFITDNKEKVVGLIKTLYIPTHYDYNQNILSQILLGIKAEINQEPKNAGFVLEENKLVLSKAENGRRLDDQVIYKTAMDSLNKMDFSEKKLDVKTTYPKIKDEEVIPLTDSVQSIVFNPLKVSHETRQWALTPSEIVGLISIERREESEKPTLSLNKAKFEYFMETLAQDINELPRGRAAYEPDGRVTSFEITKSGRELDYEKFTEDFKLALLNAQPLVTTHMIEISGSEDPKKYGILELLGEGRSKYTGSASGRVHNLSLAAERTSGILIPPGGVYSFNRSVGEISGKTGYNSAYIISNGRTVLGEGGGVCQTSTTMFRAALNSGLQIVTRHAHAYRVTYYEQESPVGLDATIYQPSVDFQFRNDTDNYILIQSQNSKQNSVLTFQIFGTWDGRETKVSEPTVTNVSAPPAPSYQDDPTLAKGVTKQVDFAAWGASVVFTREVTKNGEVLYNDTFSSRYQPWRAVFMVGTKE